ncbi:hypothetical protein [Actinomadura fibrosa]|uniref:Uncharacterized protein n=1 Tax=Actinomadura fibrosa TaxID=111802 RepID=A0ABW2XQ62_9ACTN|nr:hypothetical protein [Actinomadura fibrosa]
MANQPPTSVASQMVGDVIIRKVEPQVAPSFDDSFQVTVRQIQPTRTPTISRDEPRIEQVQPMEPTIDASMEIRVHRLQPGVTDA